MTPYLTNLDDIPRDFQKRHLINFQRFVHPGKVRTTMRRLWQIHQELQRVSKPSISNNVIISLSQAQLFLGLRRGEIEELFIQKKIKLFLEHEVTLHSVLLYIKQHLPGLRREIEGVFQLTKRSQSNERLKGLKMLYNQLNLKAYIWMLVLEYVGIGFDAPGIEEPSKQVSLIFPRGNGFIKVIK